jgi:hypothetical protein
VWGEELRAALHKLALSAREERDEPVTFVAAPLPLAGAGVGDRIDRIEQAIRDRNELRVRVSTDREDLRVATFLPYAIVLHPSGPHVVGRWDPTEPVRAVPIERLVHVEVAPGTVVAGAADARSPQAVRSASRTGLARGALVTLTVAHP